MWYRFHSTTQQHVTPALKGLAYVFLLAQALVYLRTVALTSKSIPRAERYVLVFTNIDCLFTSREAARSREGVVFPGEESDVCLKKGSFASWCMVASLFGLLCLQTLLGFYFVPYLFINYIIFH